MGGRSVYQIQQLPPLPSSVIPLPGEPPVGAVDLERGLIARHIGRYGEADRTAWLLQCGDALVPFDVSERFTSEDGRATIVLKLESFGFSTEVAQRAGVVRYLFSSQDQEQDWATVAVEGVLITWKHQFRNRDVSLRMEALGRSWKLDDFGYVEELDSDAM